MRVRDRRGAGAGDRCGIELVVIALFTGFGMGQLAHEGLHNVAAPGRVAGLGVALVIVSYSYRAGTRLCT